MNVKLLSKHHLKFLSYKGGFTGSSESTLVKMPHCGKSHVPAHFWHSSLAFYFLGNEHISQLELSGVLWKVQWLQVHIPPPEAPIGGNGDAPGPTYEACLARPGVVGAETKTLVSDIFML